MDMYLFQEAVLLLGHTLQLKCLLAAALLEKVAWHAGHLLAGTNWPGDLPDLCVRTCLCKAPFVVHLLSQIGH